VQNGSGLKLLGSNLTLLADATGTATVGSSEAIMLAVLAMKWRWRSRQKARGRPHDKPNLVLGANAQVPHPA
jgi:glutamate decarboxylase